MEKIQSIVTVQNKIVSTVKLADKTTVNSILDFEFGATGDNDIERDIGVNQAGDYVTNVLTNVDTVVYKIDTVVTELPFTLADGDTLKTTITRTVAATLSRVVLST